LNTTNLNLHISFVAFKLYTSASTDTAPDTEPHLEVVDRLSKATVVVVGLGGVGSWAAEAICRSGIGNIVFIDLDDICISNTNRQLHARQLHALSSTVGKVKIVDEMARRLNDINPACNITLIHNFVSQDNVDDIFMSVPDITA
jgi:tRNA A37 threonylcarbamoyladenosine dehydratase